MVARGDIWLVALDQMVGSEIRKTRPSVVISPDAINQSARTYLIATMTTGSRPMPFRPPVSFKGKTGLILADQLRTVDRARLIKHQGRVDDATLSALLDTLREMFAP